MMMMMMMMFMMMKKTSPQLTKIHPKCKTKLSPFFFPGWAGAHTLSARSPHRFGNSLTTHCYTARKTSVSPIIANITTHSHQWNASHCHVVLPNAPQNDEHTHHSEVHWLCSGQVACQNTCIHCCFCCLCVLALLVRISGHIVMHPHIYTCFFQLSRVVSCSWCFKLLVFTTVLICVFSSVVFWTQLRYIAT